jgi:hypothetical protein
MHRDFRTLAASPVLAGLLLFAPAAPAQERRTNRIDVEQYTIDAEVTPANSTLAVKAAIRFSPVDDNINSAIFELNNALNVARVVDDQGKAIPTSRNPQDSTIRLRSPSPSSTTAG